MELLMFNSLSNPHKAIHIEGADTESRFVWHEVEQEVSPDNSLTTYIFPKGLSNYRMDFHVFNNMSIKFILQELGDDVIDIKL